VRQNFVKTTVSVLLYITSGPAKRVTCFSRIMRRADRVNGIGLHVSRPSFYYSQIFKKGIATNSYIPRRRYRFTYNEYCIICLEKPCKTLIRAAYKIILCQTPVCIIIVSRTIHIKICSVIILLLSITDYN